MNGAVEIVDEDRSRDPELVPQASRRRDLVIEARVRRQVLTGVRLSRVDEVPPELRMLSSELIQQRTLCSAVRSGEGSKLEHETASPPKL